MPIMSGLVLNFSPKNQARYDYKRYAYMEKKNAPRFHAPFWCLGFLRHISLFIYLYYLYPSLGIS